MEIEDYLRMLDMAELKKSERIKNGDKKKDYSCCYTYDIAILSMKNQILKLTIIFLKSASWPWVFQVVGYWTFWGAPLGEATLAI